MIIPWLIAWAVCGTPAIHEWNFWCVSLIVALVAL